MIPRVRSESSGIPEATSLIRAAARPLNRLPPPRFAGRQLPIGVCALQSPITTRLRPAPTQAGSSPSTADARFAGARRGRSARRRIATLAQAIRSSRPTAINIACNGSRNRLSAESRLSPTAFPVPMTDDGDRMSPGARSSSAALSHPRDTITTRRGGAQGPALRSLFCA